MTIKKCNHPKPTMQRHNDIISGFERDWRFKGTSKLEEALLDRTNFIKIHHKKSISCVINSNKVVSIYKNYRDHVNPKRQDVTCPGPTPEQWNTNNSDTKANTEKWNKKEQKLEQKLILEAIAPGNGKIDEK